MEKIPFNKWKHNLPDMKQFTHKYLSETFMIASLILAGISAWKALVFGGIFLSLTCLVIGTILSVFLPIQCDRLLKKYYQLTFRREKTSEIISGIATIAIAFVIPFLYFGMIGLLAGSAYHYFINAHSKNTHGKGQRAA